MRLFVDICDDGVPEGVACDALDVHLLADTPHELAIIALAIMAMGTYFASTSDS